MTEPPDWSQTTWEGLRVARARDYAALPFREKVRRLEAMAEVAHLLAERRHARQTPPPAVLPGDSA